MNRRNFRGGALASGGATIPASGPSGFAGQPGDCGLGTNVSLRHLAILI